MSPKQTIGKRLLKKWKSRNLVSVVHYNRKGKLARRSIITKLDAWTGYYGFIKKQRRISDGNCDENIEDLTPPDWYFKIGKDFIPNSRPL